MTLITALQLLLALGLLNVWIVRTRLATPYRGGTAATLRAEFAAYGLPSWFFYAIGALKIGCAAALLGGLWSPTLVLPAAALLGLLMVGALAMHLKVGDPPRRSLPALAMLAMAVSLLVATAV